MCGIVGLHLRNPELYPRLGTLLTTMLGQVAERGPDSAGVAVYGDPRLAGHSVVSVLDLPADFATDAKVIEARVIEAGETSIVHADVAADVLTAAVRAAGARVVASGTELAVFKGV